MIIDFIPSVLLSSLETPSILTSESPFSVLHIFSLFPIHYHLFIHLKSSCLFITVLDILQCHFCSLLPFTLIRCFKFPCSPSILYFSYLRTFSILWISTLVLLISSFLSSYWGHQFLKVSLGDQNNSFLGQWCCKPLQLYFSLQYCNFLLFP